jgi:hypothetical protein
MAPGASIRDLLGIRFSYQNETPKSRLKGDVPLAPLSDAVLQIYLVSLLTLTALSLFSCKDNKREQQPKKFEIHQKIISL